MKIEIMMDMEAIGEDDTILVQDEFGEYPDSEYVPKSAYDKLDAENVKLRERIAELEELLPDSGRWFSAETVEAYTAENAKLWELVSCLLTCASDTSDCDRCPLNGGEGDWDSGDFCDGLLDCLRELRIEVTP